jgi:hypothetical protein
LLQHTQEQPIDVGQGVGDELHGLGVRARQNAAEAREPGRRREEPMTWALGWMRGARPDRRDA